MKGSSHVGLAMFIGMVAHRFHELPLFSSLTIDPFFYGGLYIGSLLPDIDQSQSSISTFFFGIGRLFQKIFGHRGFIHSLLACLLLWSLIYPLHLSFSMGFLLGYLSHLFGDSITNRGVPLLYPLSKRRYRTPLTFKTGSRVENFLMVILSLTIFVLLYSIIITTL